MLAFSTVADVVAPTQIGTSAAIVNGTMFIVGGALIARPGILGSRAIERGLDFIYLCYDNEGFGNTGQQYSEATPHAAMTSTSRGPLGFPGHKKDLFSIWAAHRPAYAATVIGSDLSISRGRSKRRRA